MAATLSTMVPLGTKAPEFNLPDTVSGKSFSLEELKGARSTVVMFICNHCPYVRLINHELTRVARAYQSRGISFIAISSNDAAQYPDDGPAQMKIVAEKEGYTFPYLYDEDQNVARNYDAACTPDFFTYDKDLLLRYRGQFDDARPKNNIQPTGRDMRGALDIILAGGLPSPDQTPGIGCNIKWKNA